MKIIQDDAVYVQKIDLKFLKYYHRILPENISKKIFENPKIDLDDYNKYDLFKFDEPQDIEFFQSLDFIVDYMVIKDYNNDELENYAESCQKELESISQQLYTTDKKDPEYATISSRYKVLSYRQISLYHISEFKSGLLDMPLSKTNKQGMKKLINKVFSRINYKKN